MAQVPTITIFNQTQAAHSIQLFNGVTVRDVKELYFLKHPNYTVELQRILYTPGGGQPVVLADSQLISSYNIPNGARIPVKRIIRTTSGYNIVWFDVEVDFDDKRYIIAGDLKKSLATIRNAIEDKLEIPQSEQIITIEGQEIPYDAECVSDYYSNPIKANSLHLHIQRTSRAKSARN